MLNSYLGGIFNVLYIEPLPLNGKHTENEHRPVYEVANGKYVAQIFRYPQCHPRNFVRILRAFYLIR